jgi:hypothetical protein
VSISLPAGGLNDSISSTDTSQISTMAHWEGYLNSVDSDFLRFAWPVRIRRDIDEDYNGIEGSNTGNRKDDVHLRDMITADNLNQPRHLKNIPS